MTGCRKFACLVCLLLAGIIYLAAEPVPAAALTVPKLTVDQDRITVPEGSAAVVTGRVSTARGQMIRIISGDGETLIGEISAGSSGKAVRFRLRIPGKYLAQGEETVFFLQSGVAEGLAASEMVPVRIVCGELRKKQTVSAPARLTLTNLVTKRSIGAKSSQGLKLTYKSSAPKVVSVSSAGLITRRKNGKAVITIRQEGNERFFPAEKKVTVTSRKSTRQEQIDAAVSWALKIARDNSFAYGTGSGAHHNGCYFCGTNYGPRKYMKPGKKYRKTYCCNPFVHAAYAHGARHPKMLAGCRRASGIGMQKSTFRKFGCWKCVGKPAYKNLKKGDVLVKSNHVAMYIGSRKLVEASGGTWSAGSISKKHMSKAKYRKFSFVMRYTGY